MPPLYHPLPVLASRPNPESEPVAALLNAMRRRWMVGLLVALPMLLGAAAYTRSLPNEYEATAVVAFTPEQDADVGADVVRLTLPKYAVFARSPSVLERVADETPTTSRSLEGAVEVTIPAETANLEIRVRFSSPRLAAAAANLLAEEAVLFSQDDPLLDGVVVASAPPPSEPSGPARALILLAAALASLAAGATAALAVDRLRPRATTPEEVEEYTGLRLLGSLPHVKKVHHLEPAEALHHPRLGGEIRNLRTNLRVLDKAKTTRVIVVTSAERGEGKTTTALLLAVSIGLVADQSVLLLDADTTNRALGRRLGLDGKPGLMEVIGGGTGLASVAVEELFPGVAVVPVGGAAADFAEVSPKKIQALLNSARHRYQLVLIDAPALLESDDARLLATLADNVLLVVAVGGAVGRVREGKETLSRLGADVLGVVVTKI